MLKPDIKVGIGYDSHRFVEGRPLVLGGIIIPHEYGLAGHSDADVVLHALADAILGAAGLGDIGQHFPDTDPQYKDITSTKILGSLFKLIVKKGFLIGNIDLTIIIERPRIGPHVAAMKSKIARILLMPEDDVSVKATTNEGMGFVGRDEGVAALASVLIYKDDGTNIQPDK